MPVLTVSNKFAEFENLEPEVIIDRIQNFFVFRQRDERCGVGSIQRPGRRLQGTGRGRRGRYRCQRRQRTGKGRHEKPCLRRHQCGFLAVHSNAVERNRSQRATGHYASASHPASYRRSKPEHLRQPQASQIQLVLRERFSLIYAIDAASSE